MEIDGVDYPTIGDFYRAMYPRPCARCGVEIPSLEEKGWSQLSFVPWKGKDERYIVLCKGCSPAEEEW